MRALETIAIAASLFLGACNQSTNPTINLAQVKSDLDTARANCRSDESLKTHKDRAVCLNAAEDHLLIPHLRGNGLLLQRDVELKRLELAIEVDKGHLSKELASAQLAEFYAAGAVRRDAADAQIAESENEQRTQRAALALGALQNLRPASAAPVGPFQMPVNRPVNTTCNTFGGQLNCSTQ